MHFSTSFWLPIFLAACEAAAVPKHNYTCTSFMVKVPVENATVIVPPFHELPNQYAVTAFANLITSRTPSFPPASLTGLTKIYNISAEYCTPTTPAPKDSTLHLLTHGLGFNRSYWDFYLPGKPQDAQYSYVNSVTGAGYSTLAWNRLGHAPSTIADPYTEIQLGLEIAVLASLTTLVRAGNISQVPVPQKVIHVGHSWGSQLSAALAAVAPGLSDGLVLTGWTPQSTYTSLFLASTTFHLANLNQPTRFPPSEYSSGFVTWPDKYANQYSFYTYPYFDPVVLDRAEATKYPFTIGGFISIEGAPQSAPEFQGPVLYVAPETDLIFCASNCTGLYGPESVAGQFFNAKNSVESHIQPNTGHAMNLHYNATGAHNVIIDWAQRHKF